MRNASLMLVVLAVVAGAMHVESAEAACTTVEAGKAMGPLRLGMNRAELEATGLAVADGAITTWLTVGTYSVRMVEDVVVTIGADSANHACINLEGADFALPESSLEALAVGSKASCGSVQFNIGATVIDCTNGLTLLQHMGGKEIRISSELPTVALVCHHYVEVGGGSDGVREAELDSANNVCVGERVLTAELVPDDVASVYGKMHVSTCERTDNRGATILDCHYSGFRLVFAGPEQRLHRVESIALRK